MVHVFFIKYSTVVLYLCLDQNYPTLAWLLRQNFKKIHVKMLKICVYFLQPDTIRVYTGLDFYEAHT